MHDTADMIQVGRTEALHWHDDRFWKHMGVLESQGSSG